MATTERVHYLDRKVTNDTPGVSSRFEHGGTTWTLPYSVPTDGSEGEIVVCLVSPPVPLPTTRPAENEVRVLAHGDLTGEDVTIGLLYDFAFVVEGLYKRTRQGLPETGGNLMIRNVDVLLEDTTDLEVVSEVDGKDPVTRRFASLYPDTDQHLRIPVHSKNDRVKLTLQDRSPGGFRISGLDWEGSFNRRNRRL